MQKRTALLVGFTLIILLLSVEFHVLIVYGDFQVSSISPPRTGSNLKELTEALISESSNLTDTDSDGLPDSVETVIGTDFNNTDSDFDLLDDYEEVQSDSDPLDPDSNSDGLPDYNELRDVISLDVDGDNVSNVWDFDNDNDGLTDDVDLSPFSKSSIHDSFHFSIYMNGEPTYITLQFKPRNPDNLKLYYQLWDWPRDSDGSMKDMDNSEEDLKVVPQLNVSVNVPPSQSAVEAYGILVTDTGMNVPVYPVWENDAIVAFTAQIFYNASSPMTLSMDAELMWRAIGSNDEKAVALKTSGGFYVSVAPKGVAVANSTQISSLETLQWIELGDNKVALKVHEGPYLSVAVDGSIIADGYEIGSAETFELIEGNDTMSLKAYNGKYVSVAVDGTLVASGDYIGSMESFELVDMDYLSEWTILATYTEPIMLTGFTVSESYGSDLGLFYSADKAETIRANMLLGYDFLRNSTTHLVDMPSILGNYNVDVDGLIDSFSSKDAALVEMSNTMMPQALSSLPANQVFPVVICIEENLTMVEMSQLVSSSYILGSYFPIDLVAELQNDLINSRSLKTNFYNTTGYEALGIEDIIRHVDGWQLSEEAGFSAESLVLMWNTGEQTIASKGSQKIIAQSPEEFMVVPVALESLMLVARGGLGLKAYQALKFLRMKGWNSASIARMLKTGGKTGGFRLWAKMCNKLSKAKQGWAGIKGLKVLKNVMKGLEVLGLILDVGLSILSGFMIADQIGGHLGRAMGASYGLVAATYAIAYAAILIAIGQIPYVGWIISLAIVLADIFGGFSDTLMGWFMDWFGPDDLSVVTPWLEDVEVTNVTVWDKDNNGLDAGDRISITARTTSKVNVTSGREKGWAAYSWYRPYLTISAPRGSYSTTNMTGIPPESEWIVEQGTNWKTEEYETGAWIEPGIGMPNFPVNVRINFDYGLWHVWEHFIFYLVWGEWCRHEDLNTGVSSSHFTTLRYDVLPGTIDDFASWRGVTPLDHDGDGLRDSNETISDPWKYDTDADGLNDKFEVETGTNPKKYDTDDDGLLDAFEFVYDTNATSSDTDGDGLSDYLEEAGWVIAFNYTGDASKPFTMHVHSDPRVIDTDGDGVDDNLEYWSDLNPRSQDTDGDGIKDVSNPNFLSTTFDFVTSWETPLDIEHEVRGIAADASGYVYVIKDPSWTSTPSGDSPNDTVSKFDSSGTLISTWYAGHEGYVDQIAADNKNGYLYLSARYDVYRHYFNGTFIDMLASHSYPNYMDAMTVDADGYIYVGGSYYRSATSFSPEVAVAYVEKFDPNGTLINSWGSFGNAPDQFNFISGLAVDADNGYIYVADVGQVVSGSKIRDDRVAKFDLDGNYLTSLSPDNNFTNPTGMTLDADGCIYIVDTGNNRILKYNSDGLFIASWGYEGLEDGNFSSPIGVAVDSDGYVYVVDAGGSIQPNTMRSGRVQKFSQTMEGERPEDTAPDRDGDGLERTVETTGWDVTFTNTTGTFTVSVTSDPLLNDTDIDGLTDYQEFNMTTNPRDPDTDDDGLTDFEEWRRFSPQTNPNHWDTDGDGIGDGVEITYGSDPTKIDTDGEGLIDPLEFIFNSNPNDTDTDDDGLSDYEEYLFSSNMTNPDSDGDFMFDGYEKTAGTDPQNGDTDGDNLPDGHEPLLGTNPLNGDTDGDNLTDGTEVMLWMNPLSNDTDDDGLLDFAELENGTNPLNSDTDGDGIPDSEDDDSFAAHVNEMILVADPSNETSEFADKLAQYTNVTTVSVDDLLQNYKNEPYIVIVGDPEGNGAAGQLLNSLLVDCGDVLAEMAEADVNRFAVRHGVWNETQTVVLLSQPYPQDHYRVLDILRGKIVTIQPDSATVEFIKSTLVAYPDGGSLNHTALSYNFIEIAEIDTIKQTDSKVSAVLDHATNATVQLHRYNNSTTPFLLTHASGLATNENAVGKYLEINVSENVQNQTSDILEEAYIQLYYRPSDLDRTGDGDADDPEDLGEDTLALYFFNEPTQTWNKVSEDLDWVIKIGVNTTDFTLYGESYAGYIWADLTHFSIYGLAATPSGSNSPPDISNAYPNPEYLWPPNHKFIDVTVEGVSDPDGDEVTIVILSIASNEPADSHEPDWYGVGSDTASLRAERSGCGDGRVYTITFLASDGKGGEAIGSVNVYVPHSNNGQNGNGGGCQCDDGDDDGDNEQNCHDNGNENGNGSNCGGGNNGNGNSCGGCGHNGNGCNGNNGNGNGVNCNAGNGNSGGNGNGRQNGNEIQTGVSNYERHNNQSSSNKKWRNDSKENKSNGKKMDMITIIRHKTTKETPDERGNFS